MTDEQLRELAREQYGDDFLQIDDDAPLSRCEDGEHCWVTATVLVEIPLDPNACDACGIKFNRLLDVQSDISDTVRTGKEVCWHCLDLALHRMCDIGSSNVEGLFIVVNAVYSALDQEQVTVGRAGDLCAVASRRYMEARKK